MMGIVPSYDDPGSQELMEKHSGPVANSTQTLQRYVRATVGGVVVEGGNEVRSVGSILVRCVVWLG
jgi:hypothetical protein